MLRTDWHQRRPRISRTTGRPCLGFMLQPVDRTPDLSRRRSSQSVIVNFQASARACYLERKTAAPNHVQRIARTAGKRSTALRIRCGPHQDRLLGQSRMGLPRRSAIEGTAPSTRSARTGKGGCINSANPCIPMIDTDRWCYGRVDAMD